ncbi:gamma-aminobutyric acid type B receptor subunit 2-like [Apostichopus japonicus]|uniref:gamma-aminobutyric acid type B receptor subunit 2-like n=1 Tax=Stichopus japonicus TaxID=307972 RepID=UPI003AB83A58
MLTALNFSKLILLICVCFVEDILATTPEYDVTEFWNVSVTESPISIVNDWSINKPKIPLYIAAFYANGEIWDGSGMIPAVELAVDHVNAQPNILRDYELRVIWKNSNCRSSEGIWAFHRHIVEEPQKLIFIGPACSTDAQPVAETSHFANLVTMSYSAASPTLSDRKRFPNFLRTYVSETHLNTPKLWLMQYFNWTRIGALSQNHDFFISANNHFFEILSNSSITIAVSEVINEVPTDRQFQDLKDEDLRIFVLLAFEDTAVEIFCGIYKNRLYGKGYVWITPGWYSYQWWKRNTAAVTGCTNEEVETAVFESMYIGMEAAIVSSSNNYLPSGIQTSDFQEQFLEKKRQLESSDFRETTLSGLEPFGYDAVLAVALSFNQSVDILEKRGRRLEDFTYNDTDIGSVIFDTISSSNFLGVTGPVSFSAGDREGPITIQQLQGTCREEWTLFQFYCYKFMNEPLNWKDASQYCRDQTDSQPSAMVWILSNEEYEFIGSQIDDEWYIGLTYEESLDKLVWVDTTRNASWTPVGFNEGDDSCYVWNVGSGEWRPIDCEANRPFICKMRPDFEETAIVTVSSSTNGSLDTTWHGQFMWHDNVVPLDRTPAVELGLTAVAYIVLCSLASLGILLAICFLAFNVLARKHTFVKLSSPRLNNLIVIGCIMIYLSICVIGSEIVSGDGERELFPGFCMLRIWLLSIGFVLGFGTLFSKTWRVYKVASTNGGAKRTVIKDSELFVMVGIFLLVDFIILLLWQVLDPLRHQRTNLDFGHYIHTCNCQHVTVWTGVLAVYKGLILIFGVFLAWQTRRVTIPALNDSKLIGICVYNTTLLCIIGFSMSLAFPEQPSFQFILLSAIKTFCATFVLLVIFVPKIVFVYKYPKADRRISMSNTPNLASQTPHVSSIDQAGNEGNDERNNLMAYIIKRLKVLTGYDNRAEDCDCNGNNSKSPAPQITAINDVV